MQYDLIAIPDHEAPQAIDPVFQRLLATYASETNKTASIWRATPDELLEFRPHDLGTPNPLGAAVLRAERPFFGGLHRQRIWIFWRRVLHTCHHRTQVQTWLRLAGGHVPAVFGTSGDVSWSEADPTYSVDAAKRGA